MKEFIAYLVKNLVEEPAEVIVNTNDQESGLFVEIRVATKDIARVVGRQGRTINALRTIAMAVGARFDRKIRIELISTPGAPPLLIETPIQSVDQDL